MSRRKREVNLTLKKAREWEDTLLLLVKKYESKNYSGACPLCIKAQRFDKTLVEQCKDCIYTLLYARREMDTHRAELSDLNHTLPCCTLGPVEVLRPYILSDKRRKKYAKKRITWIKRSPLVRLRTLIRRLEAQEKHAPE